MDEQAFWRLEERFWIEGPDFYDRRLADGSLMVFPHPVGVLGREATLKSIQSVDRWKNVRISDCRRVEAGPSSADAVRPRTPFGGGRELGIPFRKETLA